ncbi:hypothetical protein OQA88_707 [Cercophora sp. LCS_1]
MAQASLAKSFKALHIPGKPLILANVYDALSAQVVASLPQTIALASASYSISLAGGTTDTDLDLDTHLRLLKPIADIARQTNKPLTVDLQFGHGARLAEAVRAVIALGAVGANLEDSENETMSSPEAAIERIKTALRVAKEEGVPDFVVNARSDSYFKGGTLEESIEKGKRYLEAGATTVYILWPPGKLQTEEEMVRVVKELDGRVNVSVKVADPNGEPIPGALTTSDFARLGVARISVGPQLYFAAVKALREMAGVIYGV